ncbi:unnamed protein product [Arabidopsis lyrata]|nr:unnamed protein product [Arabidopsis lyrata]
MLIHGFIYRATHAEFVIPYEKYITSIRNPICIGTRFIMRFEMNDSPERRCAGVVAGVYDLDPYRWPNSKWRCDGMSLVSDHQERVSLWEIDPSVSLPHLSIQSSPRPWEIDPSVSLPHSHKALCLALLFRSYLRFGLD